MTDSAANIRGAKPRRLLEVLQAATGYLVAQGVEPARLTAELLTSHILKCKRLELYVQFERQLADPEIQALRHGVSRLGQGEPLQYVCGDTDFMGRRFKTDHRALIPRPETELLLETALQHAALWGVPHPVIADVGTGSGCIAISLARACPEAEVLALDASMSALSLAAENAALHGVQARIQFLAGDLLTAVVPGSLDAAVANLPYIATADYAVLPRHIREHEPAMALDGGVDGLDLIRRLVPQVRTALRPGGALFLEIGHDQGLRVRELLCGFERVEIKPDLAGHDRIAWGLRPRD